MMIVTGLRFVERRIPIDAEPPVFKRIIQQQLTEIWFTVEQGILVMKDKPLGWHDVPMAVENPIYHGAPDAGVNPLAESADGN